MSRRDRGPPNTEGMISLKVDNLTYRTTPEMLKRVFEKYGDVGDVYIPRDPYSQESRGFAFVRYYDDRDADDAIDGLNGTLLDGRELRVQLAKHARPPQGSSSSSSRRSGPSSTRRSGRRSHSRSRSRSRDRGRRRRSRSRSNSRSHRRTDRRSGSGSRHRSQSPGRKSGDRRSRSRSGQNGRGKSTSKSPERLGGSGSRRSPSGGDRGVPPNDDDVANKQLGHSRSRSPVD